MSLDTWEGSLAKIPGYCTHLNISKGEKLYDQKIKITTEFMDSKTASPLLSSTPYYQFYLATGTCCVMLLWKEPFGKRNPFCEFNCSRIDTWHDACALFCLNALPINVHVIFYTWKKLIQRATTFPPLFSAATLPCSINFSQCFDVAGTQYVRWIKFDG